MRWPVNKMMVPPGGQYFYVVPQTGVRITSPSRYGNSGIIEQVRRHMQANALPVPDNLEVIIDDYICRNVPESFCEGDPDPGQRSFITPSQVWDYTRLWFRKRFGRLEYVSKDEANRRAKLCVDGPNGQGCPLHDRSICMDCHGLKGRAARELTPGRTSVYDDVLGICMGCGCMLESKIHIAKKHLEVREDDYPEKVKSFCWQFEKDPK